jgi:hypothetical protein
MLILLETLALARVFFGQSTMKFNVACLERCSLGFLVGLGLQKVSTTDADVLEMIKDYQQ